MLLTLSSLSLWFWFVSVLAPILPWSSALVSSHLLANFSFVSHKSQSTNKQSIMERPPSNHTMDAQEAKKAQAQLGNAKEQDVYPVLNKKGETILVKEDLKQESTLFIKGMWAHFSTLQKTKSNDYHTGCEDCTIEVRGRCTKVMIGMIAFYFFSLYTTPITPSFLIQILHLLMSIIRGVPQDKDTPLLKDPHQHCGNLEVYWPSFECMSTSPLSPSNLSSPSSFSRGIIFMK